MAHVAIINKTSNTVVSVIVVDNSKFLNDQNQEIEQLGIDFIKNLVKSQYPESDFYFKQCSYNATIRKNYPGIGFTYDSQKDAFIAPKPFNSWSLDESTCRWKAPFEAPKDGKPYAWDETILNWKAVELQKP